MLKPLSLLCVVLLLPACGSWGRRLRRHHHTHAAASAVAEPVPPIVPRTAHVVLANGVTREDGTPVAIGEHVPSGVWLDVAPDGALTLDFSIDTRVEVDGGSRVRVGDARASEVIVASGAVRGLLEPVPNSGRAALHVGGPRAALQLGADGDVYYGLLPDGSPRIYVLGGLAQVRTGALTPDGHPEQRTVVAGSQTDGGAPASGVQTIEAARTRLAQARGVFGDLSPGPPSAIEEVGLLDAALADLEADDRRRAELLRATPAPGSPEAQHRVAELVSLGQHLLWRRAALLARWEACVATSGLEPAGSRGRITVAAQADRVRAAIGTAD